jgi:hypothetical protein
MLIALVAITAANTLMMDSTEQIASQLHGAQGQKLFTLL